MIHSHVWFILMERASWYHTRRWKLYYMLLYFLLYKPACELLLQCPFPPTTIAHKLGYVKPTHCSRWLNHRTSPGLISANLHYIDWRHERARSDAKHGKLMVKLDTRGREESLLPHWLSGIPAFFKSDGSPFEVLVRGPNKKSKEAWHGPITFIRPLARPITCIGQWNRCQHEIYKKIKKKGSIMTQTPRFC